MPQLDLFTEEKPILFSHKSRGEILNDRIWPELDIHSKINMKVWYGICKTPYPNYYLLTGGFECGADLSPFIQASCRSGSFWMDSSIRKVKPK